MRKTDRAAAVLLLVGLPLFFLRGAPGAADQIFPDTVNISVERIFDSSLIGPADTLMVNVSLDNAEPDSLRNLYIADHIPGAFFDILTVEVQINGAVVLDTAYIHEIGLIDEVFDGTVAHRWVIEAPPDSLGQRPCSRVIDPSTGTLQIVYTARCTTAGGHCFPGYTWAGQLSDTDASEIFGYNDTAFVTVSGNPPPVVDLASVLAGSEMFLFWSPPWHPVGIDHYIIYRDTLPEFGSLSGDSIGVTADTFYVDSGTAGIGNPGLNVYYLVRAVDPTGKESGDSNCAGEFDKDLGSVK